MFGTKKIKKLEYSTFKFGQIEPGYIRCLDQARDNLIHEVSVGGYRDIRIVSIQEKENEIVVWYES